MGTLTSIRRFMPYNEIKGKIFMKFNVKIAKVIIDFYMNK